MSDRAGIKLTGAICAAVFAIFVSSANAQLGGQTALDGPFTLEDVEDLDLHVESVGRDWIATWNLYDPILTTFTLAGSGWTLASGQSPVGSLRYSLQSKSTLTFPYEHWIDGNFGVPVPAVVGASTLDAPGNITSFDKLRFLSGREQNHDSLRFRVILECYPQNGDGTFPKLIWNYTPYHGKLFQPVELSLRTPDLVQNNLQSLSVDELLSKTRFLSFYFVGGPYETQKTLSGCIDDIVLTQPGEVVVSFTHTGSEAGTELWPYNTLDEGVRAVAAGGVVRALSGASGETLRITKHVRLLAEGGTVTIGSGASSASAAEAGTLQRTRAVHWTIYD